MNSRQLNFTAALAGAFTFCSYLSALIIYAAIDRFDSALAAVAFAMIAGMVFGIVAGFTWLALMRWWWRDEWNEGS